MLADQGFDAGRCNLKAVVEEAVQQHAAPVLLNAFSVSACLEVDGHRVDAVHLLVGVAAAVAHRDHQHQQVRALLGNLRQDLDEVEGPVLPRVLLGVRQAVEPCLELVQQQHRGGVFKQFENQLVRRDVGLRRTHALPLALDVGAVGVPLQQQVPKKLVPLTVQALTNHLHAAAKADLGDLRITQCGGPGIQPSTRRGGIVHRVIQRGHQVRLTKPSLTDHHDGAALVRAYSLDALQQVMRGVGNLQERLRGDLRRTGIGVVRQFNRGSLKALAPEFLT